MTITTSTPDELVAINLDFAKPMKASNKVTFTLVPTTAGSQVTWCMAGEHNLMGKAFSTFCNMDKMVGEMFAEGLANLDRVASASA